MELHISSASVNAAVAKLESLVEDVTGLKELASRSTINSGYSAVSGLAELGRTHGQLLNGMTGSAAEVLERYQKQIEWLRDQLRTNLRIFMDQDAEAAAAMPPMTLTGPFAVYNEIKLAAFESKDHFAFIFGVPAVTPPLSLAKLAADFGNTQVQQTSLAIEAWTTLADKTSEVAAGLREVARQLSAENAGDPIDAAVHRITQAAEAGEVFSQNAGVVEQAINNIAAIHAHNNAIVSAANAAIQLIPDPVEKIAAEQSFLSTFHAGFAPQIVSGKPNTDNLMLPVNIHSQETVAVGMDQSVGAQQRGTAGLSPQGVASLTQAVSGATGPGGSFGEVAQATSDLNRIDPRTAAAAVGTLTPQGVLTTGLGGGLAPQIGSTVSSGTTGSWDTPTALAGGRHSIASGRLTPDQLGTMAAGLSRGSDAAAIPGTTAMPGGVLSRGTKASGSGLGGSYPGVGGGGVVAGSSTAASGTGAYRSTGVATGTATGRMGMPMSPMTGGMGAGSQNNRGGKVKTVTSAVEEKANIAALLGDRGPIIPGVIGAWVRG